MILNYLKRKKIPAWATFELGPQALQINDVFAAVGPREIY